jgi:arsenite methyltransferase
MALVGSCLGNIEMNSKVNYGIDAPGLVRFLLIAGILCFGLCIAIYLWLGVAGAFRFFAVSIPFIISIYMIFMGCLMIFYSKITKLSDRDAILDQIAWRGDEQVLDVGCGRGLMLIGAAKRLTTGDAVGVDIWSAKDQSANSVESTLTNARLEGVADRVKVQTADMRKLPFEDGTFDVVVSHWVVHNLERLEDRQTTLSEMKRVLKQNGTILISDIVNREEYTAELKQLGFGKIGLSVNLVKDRFLRTISFGSFGPALLVVQK